MFSCSSLQCRDSTLGGPPCLPLKGGMKSLSAALNPLGIASPQQQMVCDDFSQGGFRWKNLQAQPTNLSSSALSSPECCVQGVTEGGMFSQKTTPDPKHPLGLVDPKALVSQKAILLACAVMLTWGPQPLPASRSRHQTSMGWNHPRHPQFGRKQLKLIKEGIF